MKTLFLVMIGTCCAAIVPRGFSDGKPISSLEYATPNIRKVKHNRIGWREWKLSTGRSSSQNGQRHNRDADNSEFKIENRIISADQLQNYLKTEVFSEPKTIDGNFPQLSNWDETTEVLVEFQTKRNEFDIPGNDKNEMLKEILTKPSEEIHSINPESMLVLYYNESDMGSLYSLKETNENTTLEILNSSEISRKIEKRSEMESPNQNFRVLQIDKGNKFEGNSEELITAVKLENGDNFVSVDTESNETNTFDNLTDSVSLHFVTESMNSIESFNADEISITNGDEIYITMLKDPSTSDFQYLVESETLILTELLDSQTSLVTEDFEEPFFIEDYFRDSVPETIEIDLMEKDGFQAKLPIFANNQTISSIEALNSTNRSHNETTLSVTSSNILLNSSESKNEVRINRPIEDAIQKTVDCPKPGLCIFWFMHQDTCMNSNQCQGTSICCKIGCSKVCVNI